MTKNPMIAFRVRMKETRQKQGITLKQLADRLGIKEATVQRYESGAIKEIPHQTVVDIAEILGVKPQYLMGWDNPTPNDAELFADMIFDKELIAHMKKVYEMNGHKQYAVYSFIDFMSEKEDN